jgi:hypothetical protein
MVRAAQPGDGSISNEQVGHTLGLYDPPYQMGITAPVEVSPNEGKDSGIKEPEMKPAVIADISQEPKSEPSTPQGSGVKSPAVKSGETDYVRVAAGGIVVVGILAGACLGVKSILRL